MLGKGNKKHDKNGASLILNWHHFGKMFQQTHDEQGHGGWEGRRCVAGTLLRLIISSRLVFRLVFRLVLVPFHVSGRLVTFRGVVFLVWHSFSLPFVRPPTRLDVL